MPYPGGLMDQPWGLISEIRLLRQYSRARDDVEREGKLENYQAADWAKRWYAQVGEALQRRGEF